VSLGILAVTRSLGDCAMKDYVTGEPYTQDVKLESGDNHLILACDGVRPQYSLAPLLLLLLCR
jgi:serine/threonine protein phosphatase PrpC